MAHIDKLRGILSATKMTQQALANHLGVSLVTLNGWLNGRSTPRADALRRIDAAFTEFVGGTSLDVTQFEQLITDAQSRRFSVKRLIDDRDLLDRFAVLMTYHTDAIEGSTMTVADTEAVLLNNKALSNRTFVEQLEAKNHQSTLLWLLGQLQSNSLTMSEETILELHLRLMNGVISDAGIFRRHAVRIAGTRVVVANHLRIPALIGGLTTAEQIEDEPDVAYLARHHATFERIHPFSDGNGRVGRLLLLALAAERKIVPPLIHRERRTVYYAALEAAQVHEDFVPLEQFIAETIIATDDELFS